MYVRTFFLRIWCELVDYPHKEKTGVINYSKLEKIHNSSLSIHNKINKRKFERKKTKPKKTPHYSLVFHDNTPLKYL